MTQHQKNSLVYQQPEQQSSLLHKIETENNNGVKNPKNE